MTESPNEKKFMRETIVKPKETKGQKAGRFFCLVLYAVNTPLMVGNLCRMETYIMTM